MGSSQHAPQHHALMRSTASAMRHRCGLSGRETLLLACSGGADSTALVRALHLLGTRRGWPLSLHVAHVHHHVRGDSADGDERFVQALAHSLALPYHRLDLPMPTEKAGNAEARLRGLRYAALTRCAAALHADAVVTAHHADDQLETLLLRLLRGAAVDGLRGIAWRRALHDDGRRVALVRPMLGVDRLAVMSFLGQLAQPYRHDETNDDVSLRRNRLRRDVLPVLRELAPHLPANLSRLSDHLRDVAGLVREQSRSHTLPMRRDTARSLNTAVLTHVLRRELRDAGVPADRLTGRTMGPMLRAIRDRVGGTRVFTIGKATVRVTRDRIECTHEPRTQ